MTSHGFWLIAFRAPSIAAFFAIFQGCAHLPQTMPNFRYAEGACDAGMTPADKTRLAAIEQTIGEGKVYAALAQLEALRNPAPSVRLMQAEALRRTDTPDQARSIYIALLDTCHQGRAHHGLGLLLARQGEQRKSLAHLHAAREALPTDARVRNDFGYGLLLAGRGEEARFEFLTALDLEPDEPRVMRNMVLLLLQQGDADKAKALADRLGLDKTTMDRLVKQASELPTVTSEPSTRPLPAGSGTAP